MLDLPPCAVQNVQLSAAMVDMASNQKPLVLWHGNDGRAGSGAESGCC